MNCFILLGFVITAVVAKPALLGYGYGPGQAAASTAQFVSGSQFQPISVAGLGHSYNDGLQYYRQAQILTPRITKNFYIHSAPEESEDEIQQDFSQIQAPRKHYNIVFIKAPKHSLRASALSYAQQLNEERTAIYVLSKKPDVTEIQSALREVPLQTHKPEVFFIKYKTPEEAQHAQHQIQAQYDQLGGTSQITDEGIAPVSSVVGILDGGSASIGVGAGDGGLISAAGSGGVVNIGGRGIGNGGGTVLVNDNAGAVIAAGSNGLLTTVSGGQAASGYLPPVQKKKK